MPFILQWCGFGGGVCLHSLIDHQARGVCKIFVRPLLQAMQQMQRSNGPGVNPQLHQQQPAQQRPQPGFVGSQGFQQRLPEQLPGEL